MANKEDLKLGFKFCTGSSLSSLWYTLICMGHKVPIVHYANMNLCLKDIIINGAWNLQGIRYFIPNNFMHFMQHIDCDLLH